MATVATSILESTLTATLNGTIYVAPGISVPNTGAGATLEEDGTPHTQQNAGEAPAPPPQDSFIPTAMEDNSYIYEDDPVHMVMDLLNFSVVPKKPSDDAPFQPLPPGELMPKSQYIKERQSLFQWIRRLRSELVATQVDKINVIMKCQETEQKMEKLVKVIAELHALYGEFIRSFVSLLTRKSTGVEVSLTVGPFGDGQDVEKMLSMLKGLANLFQSDFENLGVTKQAMREVNGYLGEKVKTLVNGGEERRGDEVTGEVQVPSVPSASQTLPLQPPTSQVTPTTVFPCLESELRQSSAISTNSYSEASTLVATDEDLTVPINIQNEGVVECGTSLTVETSDQVVSSASSVPVSSEIPPTINCAAEVTPAVPANNENADTATTTSVFEPVASQSNGRILYTLVEYPKQLLNLVGTKHALDTAKSQQPGSKGLSCTCGQVMTTPALMKYHIRYFNAKWKFMCKLCGKRYPGINFLKLHMLRTHKIVHSEGQNGCSYCSKSFQTANELLKHLENEHNKQAPVDNVYANHSGSKDSPSLINTSSPSTTITSSSATSTSPTPASSDPKSVLVVNGTRCACGLEQGTKEALISHIRLEAEEQGQFFKCTMCEDSFNHPCNLKSHFKEKHGLAYQDFQNRQFGCPNCDKTFESYEDLESHIICTHQMLMDEEEETVGMEGMQVKNQSGSEESVGSTSQNPNDSTITFHIDSSDYDDGQGTCFPVDTDPPPLIELDD